MKKRDVKYAFESANSDISYVIKELEEGVYGESFIVDNDTLRVEYYSDTDVYKIYSDGELLGRVNLEDDYLTITTYDDGEISTIDVDYDDVLNIYVDNVPGSYKSRIVTFTIDLVDQGYLQFS